MRFEVTIPGMLSVHARHAVFTALAGVEGIVRAEVELGRATVEHDGRVAPLELARALGEALAAAGFEASTVRELPRQLPML
jgi:copper chaperone CopZ